MSQIAENLEIIRQRIATAAERSGRSAGEVKLVAVSKTYPPEVIREAIQAGQRSFGENRVQDALPKIEALPPDSGMASDRPFTEQQGPQGDWMFFPLPWCGQFRPGLADEPDRR